MPSSAEIFFSYENLFLVSDNVTPQISEDQCESHRRGNNHSRRVVSIY
jgi:hypothetical protein